MLMKSDSVTWILGLKGCGEKVQATRSASSGWKSVHLALKNYEVSVIATESGRVFTTFSRIWVC